MSPIKIDLYNRNINALTVSIYRYNGLWYLAPLPIQQMFLIMQKSIKSQEIVLGSLFALSVEGLSTVMIILRIIKNDDKMKEK